MGSICLQNQEGVQIRYQNVTYVVKTQPNSTIRQLKSQLQKQNNLNTSELILSFKGNKISDQDTLQSLGFSINSDTLVMLNQDDQRNMGNEAFSGSQIAISIRSINFTEEIKISPNAKVQDLKRKIQQKRNVPISRQRLIFSGKILNDNQTLAAQQITNKSTVHCTMPLVA